ncbi:MAG TPA: hypothetical protein VHT52_20435 [Stellaceae bacterium]|jgi:hypothetical protein|nr:hypothetical protein [Stellaceae bacterium]
MVNIFQDSQKSIPKSDKQIIRVDMEQQDIGGRKSSLPEGGKSGDMSISHVPNK